MQEGVTVVINCYNSEELIPETLRHLAAQKNVEGIPWEIILIDDNSSDNTSEIAEQLWHEIGTAPLRLFRESGIGKMNAIFKSFREAHYAYISIVDDDNWVEEKWVRKVHDFFHNHEEYGVLGAASEGVFACEKPVWFDHFRNAYAIGKQAKSSGDITDKGGVWGAGASYRKQPVLDLLDRGWRPIIPGPTGRKRVAGEDIEMALAVRMLGWRVYFDENLGFKHYMPANRLTWQSLMKMKAATGRAKMVLDNYNLVYQGLYHDNGVPTISWSQKVARLLRDTFGKPKWIAKSLWEHKEGDWYLLYLQENVNYLFDLLNKRNKYYWSIRYLISFFGIDNRK